VPEEERQARFVCVVALVGTGVERTFRGTCEGTIARVPQGAGGFGYDPIFLDPESGMTFSEMTAHEKSERSHRGRALLQVRDYLRQIQLA
jgi:XTP/dITP diphosphohydrolase